MSDEAPSIPRRAGALALLSLGLVPLGPEGEQEAQRAAAWGESARRLGILDHRHPELGIRDRVVEILQPGQDPISCLRELAGLLAQHRDLLFGPAWTEDTERPTE